MEANATELKPLDLDAVGDLQIDSPLAVYTADKGLDPYLNLLSDAITEFKTSRTIETKKGRDAIKSFAYKIARFKTKIDDIGKDLSAEQKKIPKKIDKERARARDLLTEWQKDVREPLTQWEEAEEKRKAKLVGWVDEIVKMRFVPDSETSDDVSDRIERAKKVDISIFQDFKVQAMDELSTTKKVLKEKHQTLIQREENERELERLRKAEEERQKQIDEEREELARQKEELERQKADLAEKAQKEADRKALQEKMDRIVKEKEAQAEAERHLHDNTLSEMTPEDYEKLDQFMDANPAEAEPICATEFGETERKTWPDDFPRPSQEDPRSVEQVFDPGPIEPSPAPSVGVDMAAGPDVSVTTVTIPKKEYDDLLKDSYLLQCYFDAGVYNCVEHGTAMKLFKRKYPG